MELPKPTTPDNGMKLINLTPHVINIYHGSSNWELAETVAPSGAVARVDTVRTPVDRGLSFPTFTVAFGNVTGLPEPRDGVVFIVSGLVRTAVPHRLDVASPGALIRSPTGRPVGCDGLGFN